MSESINIFEMYNRNDCKFGFYVWRNSWASHRRARVVSIQWVEEGKRIKGNPPYYGGFKNPPGHYRAGKIMGPREVVLEADWLDGGSIVVNGGTYSWTLVDP
jgi:hypothetical protein